MHNVQITRLHNGIRVISENVTHIKSFSLGFWFDTGSRDENPRNNGISHFIEHMLFKGTKNRTARKISDEIESLGGYLNAFTSKEQTCYYGRGLAQNMPKTFEVLADMVLNPLFKNNDIKKEANVIIDELKDIEDSPEELIFDKFEESIFRGNSLHYPIIGTEKNIRAFSQNDLFDYISKQYGFNNLYIVASGLVHHDKLVSLTEKYFGKLSHKISKKRKNFGGAVPESKFVYKDIQQVHVILGRTSYGFNSRERTAVSVLSQILGEGSSSRLFQALRERNGITYSINSFLNSFYDVSTFGLYFSTNEKLVKKALNIVSSEFEKMKNKKISDKELKRAKESLKGSILMSLENTTNRMMRIAQSVILFNRLKTVEETVSEIEAVNKEKILELSNLLLVENNMNKIMISSKNHLIN